MASDVRDFRVEELVHPPDVVDPRDFERRLEQPRRPGQAVSHTCGGAIKELIHEQFGDGIMSAINFSVDIAKKPHATGDRVVVTFDGKFLPYDWTVAEG